MSNKSSPKRQKSIQITKPENTQMNFAKLLHDIETDPGAEGPSPDERLPGSLKSKYALKFKYDTDQYVMNANRVSPNFLCLTILGQKAKACIQNDQGTVLGHVPNAWHASFSRPKVAEKSKPSLLLGPARLRQQVTQDDRSEARNEKDLVHVFG